MNNEKPLTMYGFNVAVDNGLFEYESSLGSIGEQDKGIVATMKA
jgi:hypothetical protein